MTLRSITDTFDDNGVSAGISINKGESFSLTLNVADAEEFVGNVYLEKTTSAGASWQASLR